MIYLDTSTRSLMAACATNVSTTQAEIIVSYYDVPRQTKQDNSDYIGACFVTTTNNSTHVTACPAPPPNVTRNIESLTLYNGDVSTVPLRFLVKLDDAGTKKTIMNQALVTTQTLGYEAQVGWYIK